MAYTNAQFIAFAINTAPDNVKKAYKGLPKISQDITARVQLVKNAITQAKGKASKKSKDLKVFMMPEFFFRGPNGFYDLDEVDSVRTKLQDFVKSADYKDWLFIFGTFIGGSFPTKDFGVQWFRKLFKMVSQVKNTSGAIEIYNMALVQKGGYLALKDAHKHANIVMKRDMSGLDFLGGGKIKDGKNPIRDLTKLKGKQKEVQTRSDDGSSVFDLDLGGKTYTVGLEVCLDHQVGRLKAATDLNKKLDLLFVPSCGMCVQADKLVKMSEGALVMHVDGNLKYGQYKIWGVGGDYGDFFHSTLYQVKSSGNVVISMTEEVDVNTKNTQIGSTYARGGGKLRFYPATALP